MLYHRSCLAEYVMGGHVQDDLLYEKKDTMIKDACPLCKQQFSPFIIFPKDYLQKKAEFNDLLKIKKFEAANKEAQLRLITRNSKYIDQLLKSSNISWELLEDFCLVSAVLQNAKTDKSFFKVIILLSPWYCMFLKNTNEVVFSSKLKRLAIIFSILQDLLKQSKDLI